MARNKSSVSQAVIERFLRAYENIGVTIFRTEFRPDGNILIFHRPANEAEEIATPEQALEAWQASREGRS